LLTHSVDSHVTIVRPNQTAVDPRFLFSWIQTAEVQENIASLATGATNQIELSRATIGSMRIPIAPLNEQKRIADKLDALLARVGGCRDRLDRVPRILDRFRQSILAAAISGKLTEDCCESTISVEELDLDSNTLPNGWEWKLMREVGKIQLGRQRAPKYHSGRHMRPYLRVQNIFEDRIDLSDVMEMDFPPSDFETYQLVYGDILLNEGQSPEFLGRPAMYRDELPGACFTNTLIRFRAFDIVNRDFALLVFRHYMHCGRFSKEGKITTNIAHLSAGRFANIEFPLPSLNEQQEIVRRASTLFSYADRLEVRHQNALRQVEQLTSVLLATAFRGELVPQNPDDESVSVLLERIQIEKIRMESERKTTPTVRRSTEKTPKVPMKQLSDYLEALRSGFGALENHSNARQLFDQAKFKPEEVVQFYEALREAPEILVAFENSRQELPLQQQNSVAKSADHYSSKNGRFRLIELWLEDFKNLADYTVRFDPSHSIDIVLGWNGTGKSNLFEALVIIFRDLHRWSEKNQWTQKPMNGYRLRYAIDGEIIEVSWQPREMKRPKLKMGTPQEDKAEPDSLENITRDKLRLPRFIFGYYSGPTNRLAEHFLPMKQEHYDRLLKATSDDPSTLNNLLEQRRFFCAENHHAKYVLLAFCHKEDEDIRRFLEERLRIVGFESALFIIRKPRWAKKGQTAEDFWGATGIMCRVMERLRRFAIAPMVIEQTVPEGFRSSREDHYYFFLPDLQSLHAFAAEYQDARTFFLALESTDFSELIYDVKIQVRVKATNTEQVAITFHELSEGEQQLLMVLGLMRFTKSNQSLVLLDEPDTHLNPHWSVDYLKLLARVMSEDSGESEEQQTSQILMSTHDPLVIASLFKEQIHLLKRDWQTGVCKWDQPTIDPRGLGFTGILTSEMFGMRSDLDEETLADLDTKVRLVAQEGSLTSEEVRELEEINKRLEDTGFQKAFSDPYYAAFVRAWSRRHSDLMAGVQFLDQEQQEEIDRIAREVLDEAISELQAEVVN
jgi:restriction endonuclease S subunit/predicted ATPase